VYIQVVLEYTRGCYYSF